MAQTDTILKRQSRNYFLRDGRLYCRTRDGRPEHPICSRDAIAMLNGAMHKERVARGLIALRVLDERDELLRLLENVDEFLSTLEQRGVVGTVDTPDDAIPVTLRSAIRAAVDRITE